MVMFQSCLYVYQRVITSHHPKTRKIQAENDPQKLPQNTSPLVRWGASDPNTWANRGPHPYHDETFGDSLRSNVALENPLKIKALPSGKLSHNCGKSPFLMGKSTISTGPFSIAMFVYQRVVIKYGKILFKWMIFHCYVWLPEGIMLCHGRVEDAFRFLYIHHVPRTALGYPIPSIAWSSWFLSKEPFGGIPHFRTYTDTHTYIYIYTYTSIIHRTKISIVDS